MRNCMNRNEAFNLLKEYTFKIINHMLEKYDDNVLKVAKKLDIGKSTIYRYLKDMEEQKNQ